MANCPDGCRTCDFNQMNRHDSTCCGGRACRLTEAAVTIKSMVVQGQSGRPTSWMDGAERERVAEAAYIENEMHTRGDGMWRPWPEIDKRKQEHWGRVADAMIRTLNHGRMQDGN